MNNLVVTLIHFYCGLRRDEHVKTERSLTGSNPYPFLLWIATASASFILLMFMVVTLIHFYCGLRLYSVFFVFALIAGSNPYPFLLWIATGITKTKQMYSIE